MVHISFKVHLRLFKDSLKLTRPGTNCYANQSIVNLIGSALINGRA
jgi:hypothetical protein